MTVAQCADHWGVDRSTIMRAREVAKRGALGALGVTAGVPPRVSAGMKAALLDLVDGAVEAGWTARRACAVLEVDDHRCRRWRHRRSAGRLDDGAAGGVAVHAITPAERQAVLELFERWGDIDGAVRKLAQRGSYENLVWVSPSTLYRVLAGEGLVLPARAQRTPVPARPLGDWIEWRRHQIWIYDITHFPAAGRVAYAILDVVTRKWLATHLSVEESATQVEVVFTDALDAEGLWERIEARWTDGARHSDDEDPAEPILLVMSDNGPQMRAGTTAEFWALCSIAARFGRPGTPTDQAWIETLFGHVKTEWPHLEQITDPPTLRAELDNARGDYNTRGACTPPWATSPPTTNTKAEATPSARPATTASNGPASPASPTIATTTKTSHEHTRPMRRNQTPQNGHLLRSTSREAFPRTRTPTNAHPMNNQG